MKRVKPRFDKCKDCGRSTVKEKDYYKNPNTPEGYIQPCKDCCIKRNTRNGQKRNPGGHRGRRADPTQKEIVERTLAERKKRYGEYVLCQQM